MKCLECQDLLQQRLDGERIADAEALELHLSECVVCRDQHLAALRLLEGLKTLPKPQPAAGFAQTLAAGVLRDRRQRRAKVQRRIYLTTALAASVLLMLILAYNWLPRPESTVGPEDLAKEQPKKQQPFKEPAPAHHAQRAEVKSPFAGIPDRWADTTRDHAKVLLVAANLDAVENLPAVKDLPDPPGVREASQEVSDGVRTVTRSARRAFDFFARELPMPDMGDKN